MHRNTPEYLKVEQPFLEQLELMGWEAIEGDRDIPEFTERENFRDVLLKDRLREAIHRINLDDNGDTWLDTARIQTAISALERLGARSLIEANQKATYLLTQGTVVEGLPEMQGGRNKTIHYIDYADPDNNDFLAMSQFRVNTPGDERYILPDIVLFVNGIPIGVVECKNPTITQPIDSAITDLHKYSNQRDYIDANEGAEKLFWYNQVMIATCFDIAKSGSLTGRNEHYVEWKDTTPIPLEHTTRLLAKAHLSSQEILIAGMLNQQNLIDLLDHFIVFDQRSGQTVKILARYQQFRAVHETIQRLREKPSRVEDGSTDQRGGIIWHTQGSGKSLSMVFLVKKLRSLADLRRMKVVVVTDRIDLEDQLSETAELSGESITVVDSKEDLQTTLRQQGPDMVFALIQKYQEDDEGTYQGYAARPPLRKVADRGIPDDEDDFYPELNDSEDIIILVDEAHRSHNSVLHANLMRALPNAAKVGFTGTPILMANKKKTHQIFGPFIDTYTIEQAVKDGVTVPIMYEGRMDRGAVRDGRTLDALFEDAFGEYSEEKREAIKQRTAQKRQVLEAEELIRAKSDDMLRHYIATVLPNGYKAQVVGTSRKAAVRYQKYLTEARDRIIGQIEALDPALLELTTEQRESLDGQTQFLLNAKKHLKTIKRLEFAAVISADEKKDPDSWAQWSNRSQIDNHIARFKDPLVHEDEAKQDGLAMLCVNSMLLTGFDAPVEQAMYLDRALHSHDLLQAIARVNRRYEDKSHGLVVDYYNVAQSLQEAMEVYSADDVKGALIDIEDELPRLDDRYRKLLAVFHSRGIEDIYEEEEDCVLLLEDEKIRAEFEVRYRRFVESLDVVMPRPEALPYHQDAKQLGTIRKRAANLYRDEQLSVRDVEEKVAQLIDDHLISQGIDPKIPPVSILAEDFEQVVAQHTSPRAKASEMEHALRYHINKRYNEDPIRYQQLSERLEEILRRFEEDWDGQIEAFGELQEDVKQGRQRDETNLDPQSEAPFYDRLKDEVYDEQEISQEEITELADITSDLVEHIKEEIQRVDFWRSPVAQNDLRNWIVQYLDRYDILPLDQLEATADKLVDLARHRHVYLKQ